MTPFTLELISWIASAFVIIQLMFVSSLAARNRAVGFLIGLLGSALWLLYSYHTGQPALAVVNIFIFGLTIRGFIINARAMGA